MVVSLLDHTAKVALPHPKAEELIDECAKLIAPEIVRIESANLQVMLYKDAFFSGRAIASDRRRTVGRIQGWYFQQCCLRNAGQHWEATYPTPEQSRYFFHATEKRAREIAAPHIEHERKLVLGPEAA